MLTGQKKRKENSGQSKKLFRLYSKTILQLEYITLQPFLSIEKTVFHQSENRRKREKIRENARLNICKLKLSCFCEKSS